MATSAVYVFVGGCSLLRLCDSVHAGIISSGVGTVERFGGATSVENVGPEAILHKIKHVTVKHS